ncbi:MAG: hypothetical protein ACETWT_11935 [Thermodesulfobacteriota bacterium]
MEVGKEYKGPERRVHPRFQILFPVAIGIFLKGMSRDDRRIWEDLVKSMALSL